MARRDGRYYRLGDEGFDEAWRANMLDIVNGAVQEMRYAHERRLALDPAYRLKQEADMAEYERIFATLDSDAS